MSVYFHDFHAVNRKYLKLEAKFPRKQRWRFSLLRLNFPVPSSCPFPAFAGLSRSAGNLEIQAHNLTTDLLGDFVHVSTGGQGAHLVHVVPATTQP